MQSNTSIRESGEKRDCVVYAPHDEYASFPLLAKTEGELVIFFHTMNLEKLRAHEDHPHGQKGAEGRWAISRDGGFTWDMSTLRAVHRFEPGCYVYYQKPTSAKDKCAILWSRWRLPE